ncbi:tail protein X [Photobacterium leiognathi]|uniref:tail protein X n=1 Tax=Photobacterium leiognathi TaxID=553611 RepID=UPI00020880D9|nr:tail protein X [Photobacterium leiognathi]PSW48325.1 phage tail protein [Photobacterium leiognathi subsp. mandapamensis]GAA03241.1 phage Tail Protein X family protein [Photobacterium leiognathi subsp. mandapamensis svers.1.1.]
MARSYQTSDGDVLDLICKKEYGTEAAIIDVLEANPDLSELGDILPAGIIIVLPNYTPPSREEEDALWS